jgi:YD repeat-containing protein
MFKSMVQCLVLAGPIIGAVSCKVSSGKLPHSNAPLIGGSNHLSLMSDALVSELTSNGRTSFPVYNSSGTTPPGPGPIGLFQKPCASRMGGAHPDQGSGDCSGNFYTEVTLPTAGLSLSYNSVAAEYNYGFGYGFTLSVDYRIVILAASSQAILVSGNGTTSNFHASTPGTYLSDDLRMSDSRLTIAGDTLTETSQDGSSAKYTRLQNDSTQFALVSTKDRNGNEMLITRDANGLITKITSPFGSSTTIAYSGSVASVITDAAGSTYALNYDAISRLSGVKFPDQRSWSFGYDPSSAMMTSNTTMDGEIQQYTYYISGDLESIKNSAGYLTVFAYTQNTVTTTTSFDVNVETFDEQGRIISSSAKGISENYARDTAGRVTSSTDPVGNTTTYAYDAGDPLLASVSGPFGVSLTIQRDANRNVTQMTSTQGTLKTVSTYAPSQFGLVTSIVSGTSGQDVTGFTYSPAGNLTKLVKNGQQIMSLAYDANGRMTSQTDQYGKTSTYDYYAAGPLRSQTDPLGRTTNYAIDSLGNTTQVTTPLLKYTQQFNNLGAPVGESSVAAVSGAGGNVSQKTSVGYFPNGAPRSIQAISRVSGAVQSTLDVTYDNPTPPGRRVSSILTNARGETYDFDN